MFFNLSSADTNEALQAIERDITPKLAQHQSALYLNRKLFARIADLYERRDDLDLDAEQQRVLERTHTGFVRAGAKLAPKSRKRIAEINMRLATLATDFGQNVLADEQSWHLFLNDDKDLAGLPESVRAQAAQAAIALGKPGLHAITLARSSVEPFLTFSARRDLREEAFKAWAKRGENGGKTDNRKIVVEIVKLRAEMARLLGYESYAAYSLEDTMAKTPEAVRGLMDKVWPAGLKRAAEERAALEARARDEGGNFSIEAWDWRYYSEKERKARFDLDEAEVRSYLVLDNVLEAAFDTASKLFGIVFEERDDVQVYHPDVRAWEVRTKKGEHVGLFLGDYFARPSKRSGAWMSSFRTQQKLTGDVRPIVTNVMSVARGAEGTPTLLSFDDARTLFHELGHGLHGLLSDVTYPSLAMTNVLRDFVELPSQLYEHWLSRPEVLKKFALHYATGKPMPDRLLKQLKAARTFNQGFQTVEYTASALLDMELHTVGEADSLDIDTFEKERACAHRHADGNRAAPSRAALPAHHRRLRGRLLQLPVVGGDGRGRLRGLRGSGRHLRPQDGDKAQDPHLLSGRQARRARSLCGFPRPRAGNRRPPAQTRVGLRLGERGESSALSVILGVMAEPCSAWTA